MKKILTVIMLMVIPILSSCTKKDKPRTNPDQLVPGTAAYLTNEGVVLMTQYGEVDQAKKKFEEAIEKDPNAYIALNALGIIALNNREFETAEKYFLRVLAANSNFIDAHNSLGIIYIETGQDDKAKENLLIAATSVDYRTPENAYLNLANMEMKYNRLDSAMRYIDKGLAQNKAFAPLYNMKGLVLEMQKKYDDAIFNYERALSHLKIEDVNYLINIGRTYAKMGNKNKALDVLESALAKTKIEFLKQQIRDLIKSLE